MLNPTLPRTVLSQTGVVHKQLGTKSSGKAWLFLCRCPSAKQQVSLNAVLRRINPYPQALQRLHNLHLYAFDCRIHALHTQGSGRQNVVLHTVTNQREAGVDDIQVGINSHAQGKKRVAFNVITVEKITVVEIPALARISYGFRALMNWVIVGL